MREITEKEAKQLINSHEAGWWATHANPPIIHDKQIAVSHKNRWYLLKVPEEMEIKLLETFRLSETHGKGLFRIVISCDELGEIIKKDASELPSLGKVGSIPAYYGGNSDHPDLRN
jgi:hypothetical protein